MPDFDEVFLLRLPVLEVFNWRMLLVSLALYSWLDLLCMALFDYWVFLPCLYVPRLNLACFLDLNFEIGFGFVWFVSAYISSSMTCSYQNASSNKCIKSQKTSDHPSLAVSWQADTTHCPAHAGDRISSSSHLPKPEKYAEDPTMWRGFILYCQMLPNVSTDMKMSEQSKLTHDFTCRRSYKMVQCCVE